MPMETEETSSSTSLSFTSSSSAATTSSSVTPPTSQPTSPVYLELTFDGVSKDKLQSKDLEEELVAVLVDLLQLDLEPRITVTQRDTKTVVLIDFGRNQEDIERYALLLLTSDDNQWLTFREANV